jgi:hypothetical protein
MLRIPHKARMKLESRLEIVEKACLVEKGA